MYLYLLALGVLGIVFQLHEKKMSYSQGLKWLKYEGQYFIKFLWEVQGCKSQVYKKQSFYNIQYILNCIIKINITGYIDTLIQLKYINILLLGDFKYPISLIYNRIFSNVVN